MGFRPVPGGETPPELAGEDARATYRGPLAGEFWRRLAAKAIFKTRSKNPNGIPQRSPGLRVRELSRVAPVPEAPVKVAGGKRRPAARTHRCRL